MGFDPPSAEVQTSTECKFGTFTLQATTAGLKGYLKWIDFSDHLKTGINWISDTIQKSKLFFRCFSILNPNMLPRFWTIS